VICTVNLVFAFRVDLDHAAVGYMNPLQHVESISNCSGVPVKVLVYGFPMFDVKFLGLKKSNVLDYLHLRFSSV
jgi:hypothetical protein